MGGIIKPAYGAPCNGCGLCCRMEVCGIGKLAFPGAEAPCPGLRWNGGKHRCALIEMEATSGLEPMMAEALGIGKGCDSDGEVAT